MKLEPKKTERKRRKIVPPSYKRYKRTRDQQRFLPNKIKLLKYLNKGYSLNDVAKLLGWSRETVRNHILFDHPELFVHFTMNGAMRKGVTRAIKVKRHSGK